MVANLWATIIAVLSLRELLIASWTIFSDSESSAEVASSNIRICGFLIKALAMAILWRSPPESAMPRSPTIVLNLLGNALIKLKALAIFVVSMIFCSSMFSSPYLMLL